MSKLTTIAKQLLIINDDLPGRLNYSLSKLSPRIDDFDMYTFEQVWGSTSLGFGGIGGQAMTSENTYVFVPRIEGQECFVYFGGKLAYSVPYCEQLMEDIKNQRVASVAESSRYTQ